MSTRPPRLGLISALQEEQNGLIDIMRNTTIVTRGMRDYVSGKLGEMDCVCVLSRIGKVGAAATVATLIERFDITHVVFTGVAGSADQGVRVGDIVIADMLVQHDMDATPLFPRFEVPLTGQTHFASDMLLSERLAKAAADFVERDLRELVKAEDIAAFKLQQANVHRGLIASGDEFIDCRNKLSELKSALPSLLAVEMEGAAVAQVCFEFSVPFAVIRTVSDGANEDAPVNFTQFIERVAARYAFGIMKRLCAHP